MRRCTARTPTRARLPETSDRHQLRRHQPLRAEPGLRSSSRSKRLLTLAQCITRRRRRAAERLCDLRVGKVSGERCARPSSERSVRRANEARLGCFSAECRYWRPRRTTVAVRHRTETAGDPRSHEAHSGRVRELEAGPGQLYELLHSDWLFRMPSLRLVQAHHPHGRTLRGFITRFDLRRRFGSTRGGARRDGRGVGLGRCSFEALGRAVAARARELDARGGSARESRRVRGGGDARSRS
jgi:hypothetical protein